MGGGHHNNMHHNAMPDLYGQQQMGGYGGGFNNGMMGGYDMGFNGHNQGIGGHQQYGGPGQGHNQGHLHQQSFGAQGGYAGAGNDGAMQFAPGAFSVVPPSMQQQGQDQEAMDPVVQGQAYAPYL